MFLDSTLFFLPENASLSAGNLGCKGLRRSVTYHVEAPNCLHMDGNYKLIRWKFVVHGAIDGYSRVIVMLKCSTNNEAETVHHFTQAGSTFGLADKLRTDGGGQNVDAWQYMIQHRNSDSVIVGTSVHNERIECLWRDVRRAVLDPFRDVCKA